MRKFHCVLVPMHSESQVIEKTLRSLKQAGVIWKDVYLVDDGSNDETLRKILEVGFPISNVLPLLKNVGKTQALISAFNHFELAKNYEWMNSLDGDTLLSGDYMQKLKPVLEDQPKSTAAVCSRVASVGTSWNPYVAYRVYEYWLMQNAYKRAQGHINLLTVLPGCGTTFRTEVFALLCAKPDPAILTEDMDFTIRIHSEGLGKLVYFHDAVVITQDPGTLLDYKKQNRRWFEGGWQVYLKHKMWQIFKNGINMETSFLFVEGTLFSFLFLFALIVLALQVLPNFVHYFFLFDSVVFGIMGITAALFEWNFKLVLYMPFFYCLRIAKCIVFVESFIRIVILKADKKKKLLWNKVNRY